VKPVRHHQPIHRWHWFNAQAPLPAPSRPLSTASNRSAPVVYAVSSAGHG
jgi:hypothetical protein